MKYEPLRVVLICDDSMVSSDRHPLELLPDAGYEVFVQNANGIVQDIPDFLYNQIYVCFDPQQEDCKLRIHGDNILPALSYSYQRGEFNAFLQLLRGKCAGILSASTLYVYDCTVDDFMQDDNFPDALENIMEIVVKQEYRSGAPMPCGIASRHFERRRPCRYPFECLTLDQNGNVLQCPYCRRVLASFRGMDVLKNDPNLLYFLATQLLMDFEKSPECRNCRYWLDGWLGDEVKVIEYQHDRRAIVSHEGHHCRIFRMEGK